MSIDWYWNKGLHDAEILGINSRNLDYNYECKNPTRNYLEINLNAQKAMFDTTIKSIHLYNYKLINCCLDNLCGYWWLKDELKKHNDRYLLKIYLMKEKEYKELEIVFEYAEVIR